MLSPMPSSTDAQADLIAYLDFHVEAGADAALDEHPHDRFSEADAPAPTLRAPRRAAPRAAEQPVSPVANTLVPPPGSAPPAAAPRTFGRAASAQPDEAASDARARARQAKSLDELERILADFDACPLRFTAKNLVFADGNPEARVMFLGEAPGADEDRIGKPFMGRSGQLLDKMMKAVGLDRTSAYIGNIVPWRPPGNRNPTPQEVAVCRPFVERQIELVDPDIIVCLGAPATQTLTGTKDGILRTRGRLFPYKLPNREVKLLATLHPAFLLRQPVQKRLAWRDFRSLRALLDGKA
ncbi:uracil-DNA glycosylase [Methylobacterium radiotolerans]|uniref:uracil-DNA glycosylase n=1 Tax=Methylobacterium radiotolerans TaxID=31998 RepID=UPI000B787CE2|nr:uracil-DNA glycosylase [Methylobacterium radiotolerans]OXE42814.1 uracil-DNA glycosylase [Methylobacterium radiotolerans]UIY40900.1 uracil-DNA glycosylase [Methylobacterium radiotolerans]